MNPALERWRGAGWQLLREVSFAPPLNLALDQVLTQQVQKGHCPPTLRFWNWTVPAVILGRFQSVTNEVDVDQAKRMNVEIARRMSGGGAMFVEPDKTIAYSLYVPERLLEGLSIKASYEVCDSWTVRCFQGLGVDTHYAPLNDITSAHGKIGGAAQARKPGVVLHHTAIAYEMDPAQMRRLLRIGRPRISAQGTPSAAKEVFPLRRQTDLPRCEIMHHLIDLFRREFGLAETQLTQEVLHEAEEWVKSRYATKAWTFDLP